MEYYKFLSKALNIKENDVISIVGSGGKTTFLYTLQEELNNNKVVISTTTKMFIPKSNYNILNNENDRIKKGTNILIGEKLKDKFTTSVELIEYFKNKSNFTILECDGSKMKPLKGWNENEPVVPLFTTKTIGIIPLNVIGKQIDESFIHRFDKFLEISKAKKGDLITKEIIKNLVENENGLFKNSVGERILFLNKLDEFDDLEYVKEIVKIISKDVVDFVLIGSLKKKNIYLV